jgi:hypothetical protein
VHLDVFKADGFSVTSLTEAINKVPYVPGLLAPLFVERRVSTLTINVEEKNGVLTLVAPTPRGSQSEPIAKGKRSLRPLAIPHFERPDAVMADEVQGIRAFGSETELETLQGKIAERMATHTQDFEATAEYSRIGAIKGIVSYADGTTLNLFTTFEVSQETEVAFDLAAANPTAGVLRKKCDGVHRLIAKNLGGTPFSGIRSEVGDDFWDDLIAHKEVRETYLNQQEASQLREGTAYQEFNFGGIIWRNYRGAASIGGVETPFVHADKAHFYPVGVNGLFTATYAPADYIETVNTQGQRLYMKQFPMPNDKGINIEVQMNALHICTRPKVLIKGKRQA